MASEPSSLAVVSPLRGELGAGVEIDNPAAPRIVLTHDRATMPDFAYARVVASEAMHGLFVVHERMPVGQAIDELLLVVACSTQAEWKDTVLHLPLP